MKILHTSDWHLGRSLYGRKRYNEFSEFLDWLSNTIEQKNIEALLVSGDIFDTSTPGNRAQELYYRFLCKVANSCCRHIVVIAGNHDSPSFLNAPKELLRVLNVHVVGSIMASVEDEVIILHNKDNEPEAIICAVPYLRDKDIRIAQAGESITDKNTQLLQGLKKHYADVCAIAQQKQVEFAEQYNLSNIPVIAMGHLFTAGGQTIDGDGVRELYVGSLAHVGSDVFPETVAYAALGHLHVAQTVGDCEHIRYSGSPIPMGYGEAKQQKKVMVVEFHNKTAHIEEHPVPCFQLLERIEGSLDVIEERIAQLENNDNSLVKNIWLEIIYTGSTIVPDLNSRLEQSLEDSAIEIRRIQNKQLTNQLIATTHKNDTLDDLSEYDVFQRCLNSADIPEKDQEELRLSYNEIIKSLHEEDSNAE